MWPKSLAITILALAFLFLQQPNSVNVKCALVNIAPLRLACDDKDKTEIVIPIAEWPESWHGPFLTGIYNAELRDGKLFALETLGVKGLDEGIRAKSLNEQRRWRKHPTQRNQ